MEKFEKQFEDLDVRTSVCKTEYHLLLSKSYRIGKEKCKAHGIGCIVGDILNVTVPLVT